MRILLFLYYASTYNCKRLTPDRKPSSQAILELTSVLICFLIGITISIFHRVGLWQWALAHWPYEYGHTQSKNLLAPTGVLSIIVCTAVYLTLKNYLSRKIVKDEIETRFNNIIGNLKAEKFTYVTPILVPFNILSSIFFAASYWLLFSCCMLVWVSLELWVRKTFYWKSN